MSARPSARRLVRLSAVCAGAATLAATAACGGSTNNSLTSPTTANAVDTPSVSTSTLSDWANGGGLTDLQQVGTDLGTISKDAGAADWTALSADCAKLGVDVTTAQNYGPMPNATMQAHWSKALTDFGNAATECVAGAQNQDPNQLQQSLTDIESGGAEVSIVDSAINQATP